MLRQKFGLFAIITFVFMGGAVLLYGQQTGGLTILADASSLAGNVTIKEDVDLQKGITAGNGNTQLASGGIELITASPAQTGTAQFDIGNPDVTQFQRFRNLQSQPSAPGAEVRVQFAGSLDGISFHSLGNPTALEPSQAVDLTTMVPSGSHFLRLIFTLQTSIPGASPRLEGFSLDYEVLGVAKAASSLDVTADQTADLSAATVVTVNGTLAGSTDADAGNAARKAATKQLAGTGVNFWLIGLLALWLFGSVSLFILYPKPFRRAQQ